MEGFGGSGMVVVRNGVKKRRSDASRRPRNDSHVLLHGDISLPASMPLIGNVGHVQNHDNNVDKVVVSDGPRSENKLKKLKLKVGGVTRTIHTQPTADFASEVDSSATFKLSEKPFLENKIDGNNFSGKRKSLEVKFKNIPKTDSTSQIEHVRKSNRVPKRRVLDIGFDEDNNEDEEVRYLERLNAPKTSGNIEGLRDFGNKRECVVFKAPKSRVVLDVLYGDVVGNGSSRLGKDYKKKSRPNKEYEDVDYVEQEEQTSDEEHGFSRNKIKRDEWKESTPSTRNRSLHSISSSIDISNVLPLNSKKKKQKLSEVEQQLKKTEAAQRRKMQSEKAVREAEAEAIRKILGQDSARKKREEKMKKQRDKLLQEREANACTLAANTVRWVNSPTGTTITFSVDIGLPSIFNAVPCRYPGAREKCAGPNCSNAYKYRDAKSNLPLCSLQCYKSVNRNVQPLVTC